MGLERHSHPGIEQGYVIQGATVQQPGKDPIMFPTGALLSNMPDVVHGGFKVVRDTSLKAFSVYVVDRNRPFRARSPNRALPGVSPMRSGGLGR
jgi:hypothetical protein